MNIVIARNNDYTTEVIVNKLPGQILQQVARFSILGVDLVVGIGGINISALYEITAHDNQIRVGDTVRFPPASITAHSSKKFVVADTRIRRPMQVRDMEHRKHSNQGSGGEVTTRYILAQRRLNACGASPSSSKVAYASPM